MDDLDDYGEPVPDWTTMDDFGGHYYAVPMPPSTSRSPVDYEHHEPVFPPSLLPRNSNMNWLLLSLLALGAFLTATAAALTIIPSFRASRGTTAARN